MLNQLIESKSSWKESKTRGGYLLTTFVLVISFCFSALVWSLFAKDLGMTREEFELSNLIAPIVENAPPEPVEKTERREQSAKSKSETITRQTNTLRIEESPIAPKTVSVAPNSQKARPNGYFLVSDKIEDESQGASSIAQTRSTGEYATGISQISQPTPAENGKKIEPPPAIKKAAAETTQKPKQTIVTGGVVNGQATSLPKPIYPAAAKIVKASGEVNVQIIIDEAGNIVSAKAVSGHPLLRAVSEKAAFSAKFRPTLLSNQPVKVSGIIVYKFSF